MSVRFTACAWIVLALSGCRSEAKKDGAAGAAAGRAAPSAPAPMTAPGLSLVRCGWGAAGPEMESPPWVIALVDVRGVGTLSGFAASRVEVLDASGVVATQEGHAKIRVQEGSPTDSLAATESQELQGGALPAGDHRVRIAARLKGRVDEVAAKHPTRCRLVLTNEGHPDSIVEGPLEPQWKP